MTLLKTRQSKIEIRRAGTGIQSRGFREGGRRLLPLPAANLFGALLKRFLKCGVLAERGERARKKDDGPYYRLRPGDSAQESGIWRGKQAMQTVVLINYRCQEHFPVSITF